MNVAVTHSRNGDETEVERIEVSTNGGVKELLWHRSIEHAECSSYLHKGDDREDDSSHPQPRMLRDEGNQGMEKKSVGEDGQGEHNANAAHPVRRQPIGKHNNRAKK
jgi:hypothetical protein